MDNEAFKDVIRPSIDSLLNNSPNNSEFILVSINPSDNEDYSLFDKFKIVEAYSPNKSNIIHSGPFTWAFNIGIKEARFPFVCTAGIDMLYPPNFKDIVKTLSKKPVAILDKQDGINGKPMRSYAHVGFLRENALAIGGFDERMLGGWATDLDFWSRLIKKSIGIIKDTVPKDTITKIVLTHIKHSITHKRGREIQSRLNTILCKTNPIRIGIDECLGDIENPPRMLSNFIDYDYLFNNPYKQQLLSYNKPFVLQHSKEWEVPYLIKYTAPYKHKCLDVGCGFSPLARWLSDFRDCDVTAIDNQSNSYPDKELWGKVKYENADIRNLPFKDNSFDRVYCVDVLKHLSKPDVKIAISELARVCRAFIGISLDFRFSEKDGLGFNYKNIQDYILGPISNDFTPIFPLDFSANQKHLTVEGYSYAAFVLVSGHKIS